MKVINLHQEEKELIALAIDNNRQAQHQIYSKYAPKMLGVCRQYVKDLHEAEDVMITAFMKVFVNLLSFKHEGSFEGWIRRIIINECLSHLRAKKKITFLEDQFNYEDETENNIEKKYSVDEIQCIIDNLPDGYRTIFNLYCIEGYKHHEIAEMIGISEGTSKSQLAQARKALQKNITKLNSIHNGTQ